jgi:hypothetical protein
MIKKHEASCFSCGEPAPNQQQSSGGFVSVLLVVALVVAVGATACTYFSIPLNGIFPGATPAHHVSTVPASKHG